MLKYGKLSRVVFRNWGFKLFIQVKLSNVQAPRRWRRCFRESWTFGRPEFERGLYRFVFLVYTYSNAYE
jgi:hypothetical protein